MFVFLKTWHKWIRYQLRSHWVLAFDGRSDTKNGIGIKVVHRLRRCSDTWPQSFTIREPTPTMFSEPSRFVNLLWPRSPILHRLRTYSVSNSSTLSDCEPAQTPVCEPSRITNLLPNWTEYLHISWRYSSNQNSTTNQTQINSPHLSSTHSKLRDQMQKSIPPRNWLHLIKEAFRPPPKSLIKT